MLRAEIAAGGLPGALEGELIDLLNFFEFVSGLTRRGLVARSDVDWMFRSFIDRLARVDFIREYVFARDYEELAVLFRKTTRDGRSRR